MKALLPSLLFIAAGLTFSRPLYGSSGPLRFIENKGQISDQHHHARPDIQFVAGCEKFSCHFKKQGFSYQLFKESRGIETAARPIDRYNNRTGKKALIDFYRLDMNWINSNPQVVISKEGELPGYENYYSAVCPQGATRVKSFTSITYHNLYPGVDMKWYNLHGKLKYDYFVNAGADYNAIQWTIDGAERLELTGEGELVIVTPLGRLVEEKPVVMQEGRFLKASWKINGNTISFDIKGADPSKDLLIDPLVRSWGTYYGGSSYDDISYSHVDAMNNYYISGTTSSPTSLNIATVGSHQSTYGGGGSAQSPGDVMLIKMNSNGVRQWATYYGGSENEGSGGCSSDSQGNIYLLGMTTSTDAGVISTPGSYQPTLLASKTATYTLEVFLVKFDQSGVRLWGTYYGDSLYDWANGICVDKFDNVFISGGTEQVTNSTLMATTGCYQPQHAGGTMDAFLTKFNSAGSRVWSTFMGGEGLDHSYYCADDTLGNIYITGMTTSTTALTIASANAHKTTYSGGNSDGYLVKFSNAGARLWGTYYGDHSEEYGLSCEVDHLNGVVLFGTTDSFLGTSFGTPGTAQPAYGGGNSEGYVAKFNSAGVRRWGTYYGGLGYEEGGVGCVSKSGSIYFCGRSSVGSTTAIATCGTYQFTHGGGVNDCFIVQLDSLGKREWGTFFGGSGDEPTWSVLRIDASNILYLAGLVRATTPSSIIVTAGAHQTTYGGGFYDVFIERFNPCTVTQPLASGNPLCVGQQGVFQSSSSCVSKWYSDASLKNMIHTGPTFTFNIITADTAFYYADESCGFNKAAEVLIQAGVPPVVTVTGASKKICAGETVTLTPAGAVTYSWTGYIETGALELKPGATTNYTVAGFSADGCKSTTTVQVQVDACAGLAEIETIAWNFFPNPVNGLAELKVDQAAGFSLQGVSGNIIWQEREVGPATSLDFSELPAGIYFGHLKTEKASRLFKVVVAR